MSTAQKPRPKYFEFNLAHHWSPAVLSIFHRITGLALFFPLLPLALYGLQSSLASAEGYAQCREFLAHPLVKFLLLGVVWFYAHHFWAGLRYLLLDMHIAVAKAPARASANLVFAAGLLTVLLAGWWLW